MVRHFSKPQQLAKIGDGIKSTLSEGLRNYWRQPAYAFEKLRTHKQSRHFERLADAVRPRRTGAKFDRDGNRTRW